VGSIFKGFLKGCIARKAIKGMNIYF